MSSSSRRASHIGVLRTTSLGNDGGASFSNEQSLRKRRQSIAGGLSSGTTRNNENNVNGKNQEAPSTPHSAPKQSHNRTKLGSASSYYFSGIPKTPMEKAVSAKKKLAASMQNVRDNPMDASFDAGGDADEYTGTLPSLPFLTENSYISSSSGSDSPGGDLLNQSVLSDTTELTASNFVFTTAARQRWSLGGTNHIKTPKQEDTKKGGREDVSTVVVDPANPKPPPPNSTATEKGNKNRRTSLPPGTMARTTALPGANKPRQRRDSWQGRMSPATEQAKQKATGFLAKLQERRLSRQSVGSRLSIGSATSKQDDTTDDAKSSSVAVPRESDVHETPAPPDDDSIVSAGSLFDDLLSGGKSKDSTSSESLGFILRPSMTARLSKANSPSEKPKQTAASPILEAKHGSLSDDEMSIGSALAGSEAKSVATEEAVGFPSQASQMGTPVEEPPSLGDSPRPLPEAVAFEHPDVTTESLRATVKSPFCTKQPHLPSSVTPKKFRASAERVVHPRDIQSPAGNLENVSVPFSAEKKRKRSQSIELADDLSFSQKKGRTSSINSTSLNSSFRKAASRQNGSALKVAFGSPDVVEFNATSPSMSVTPMPKASLKNRFTVNEEATVEIENDMNDLFDNMNNPEYVAKLSAAGPASTAGGTPFALRKRPEEENEDTTRELETNLAELLNQAEDKMTDGIEKDDFDDAKSDMSDGSHPGNLVGEHTEALELSMNELLANAVGSESQQSQPTIAEELHGEDEEDQTVELEANMGALLLAAASPEQADEIVLPDDETPIAGHRRSSIASRRFSLGPQSRYSLDELSVEAEDHEMEDAEENPVEEKEPVLDLQVSEILGLAKSLYSSEQEAKFQDIFRQMGGFLEENPSVPLADALNMFLREVCDHIETVSTPDVEDDYISQLPEDDQAKVLMLQNCLRSENKELTEKKLGQLMEASARQEGLGWEQWLLDTAVQMKDYLAMQHDDLSAEIRKVSEELQKVDDAECVLSSIKARAVQKARRKSLDRRKSAATILEEDVDRLEKEIKEATAQLNATNTKKALAARVLVAVKERNRLSDAEETARTGAESTGKKWGILKGLAPWEPRVCTRDCLSLAYVGPCPAASVSVSIQLANGKFTSCLSKIDPSVFPKNRPRNTEKYKSIMKYLQSRTQRVCDKVSACKVDKLSEVGEMLRGASWELHRIEMTSDEIHKLHRRYNAVLTLPDQYPGDPTSLFEVRVPFGNASSHNGSKLDAIFEISESYPFCPMDMRLDVLEGDVDVDIVQENVVKTAKPGFGYLARTCDVIAASMP